MPTMLQGTCAACGFETPVYAEGYLAVRLEQPVDAKGWAVAGAVLHGRARGDAMAEVDDPRFAVLRHPLESKDLERLGYTWRSVRAAGRLTVARNVACRTCGTVYPHRRLASGDGCAMFCITMICSIALGLIVWAWKGNPLLGCVVTTVGAMLLNSVTSALDQRRLRRRFSDVVRMLKSEQRCPSCDGTDAVVLARAKGVPCPRCHAATLTFVPVGIS